MPDEHPAIQNGGSLILAWQIKNKRVLVVGGGEVSRNRPKSTLAGQADQNLGSSRTNTQCS